jgi:hypothetical protein
MNVIYRIFNVLTLVAACAAVLSLVCPPINPWIVDFVGPRFASYAAECGPYFAYLVILALTTICGLLAVMSFPLEFEAPRFAYYCMLFAWGPVIYLALLGAEMYLTGQLFWSPR